MILMGSEPAPWGTINYPLGVKINSWTPEIAEKEFLKLFYEIMEILHE